MNRAEMIQHGIAAWNKAGPDATDEDRMGAAKFREQAADTCDKLGDEEFAERCKKGNMGSATLAQRHYMKCAAAIRALSIEPMDAAAFIARHAKQGKE